MTSSDYDGWSNEATFIASLEIFTDSDLIGRIRTLTNGTPPDARLLRSAAARLPSQDATKRHFNKIDWQALVEHWQEKEREGAYEHLFLSPAASVLGELAMLAARTKGRVISSGIKGTEAALTFLRRIDPLSVDFENGSVTFSRDMGQVIRGILERGPNTNISASHVVHSVKDETTNGHEIVLNALRSARIEGNLLFLDGKLPRAPYELVKRFLEGIGGNWNARRGAHVFKQDATEIIQATLADGDIRRRVDLNPHEYFPTPREVALKALEGEYAPREALILEPSIGQGHLADVIREKFPDAHIGGFEIDLENFRIAREKRYQIVLADFLQQAPEPCFDMVVMNPPFSNGQDIAHVERAFQWLKPGGRLISIMAGNLEFRQNRRYESFRNMVNAWGTIEENAAAAFRESGTMAKSVIVRLTRPLKLEDEADALPDTSRQRMAMR